MVNVSKPAKKSSFKSFNKLISDKLPFLYHILGSASFILSRIPISYFLYARPESCSYKNLVRSGTVTFG